MWLKENNRISNCHAEGSVTGHGYLGGLISYITDGTSIIEHSSSDVTITGEWFDSNYNGSILGGLIGVATDSTIYDSYAKATINGFRYLGGLVATSYNLTIFNSFSVGDITGARGYLGGLIAVSDSNVVKNSYSTTNVTSSSNESYIGGFIGIARCDDCDGSPSLVQNCYATGDVNAPSANNSGILIGQNGNGSDLTHIAIKNSYGLGNINGNNNIGLIGANDASIQSIFNGGQVNGTGSIGNIAGSITTGTNIDYSYSVPQSAIPDLPEGTTVSINDIKLSSWFRNTLNFDNNWYYEDGYYPLIYKLDENGNPTTTLLEGQIKKSRIKID